MLKIVGPHKVLLIHYTVHELNSKLENQTVSYQCAEITYLIKTNFHLSKCKP